MKKYLQKMYMIQDTLFLNKVDAQKVEDNETKEIISEVFVGLEEGIDYDLNQVSSDFFGSWIFKTEKEAQKEIEDFNNN